MHSREDSLLEKCCRVRRAGAAPDGFILAVAHAVQHWVLHP